MFINFNASTGSFSANTFRNNGGVCGDDTEIMECVNDGTDATMSVEVAQSLIDAHNDGNYNLDSYIFNSIVAAVSEATQ